LVNNSTVSVVKVRSNVMTSLTLSDNYIPP
jgi:hypothetical protein